MTKRQPLSLDVVAQASHAPGHHSPLAVLCSGHTASDRTIAVYPRPLGRRDAASAAVFFCDALVGARVGSGVVQPSS